MKNVALPTSLHLCGLKHTHVLSLFLYFPLSNAPSFSILKKKNKKMRYLRSRSFGFGVSDPNNIWVYLKVGRRCMVTSCRAVVLPRFGGPEVLELRPNVDVPDLNPNQVLVRARAVSINPLDTRVSVFALSFCLFPEKTS